MGWKTTFRNLAATTGRNTSAFYLGRIIVDRQGGSDESKWSLLWALYIYDRSLFLLKRTEKFFFSTQKSLLHHVLLVYSATALWVKSDNRGILKCLNVNDHYKLIFYRKMFISFLSDAKLLHVYDWYLGLIIYVKYLRSYLQKTWRGGQTSLKFCVLANQVVPRKKVENNILVWGPLHGANIGQIFL